MKLADNSDKVASLKDFSSIVLSLCLQIVLLLCVNCLRKVFPRMLLGPDPKVSCTALANGSADYFYFGAIIFVYDWAVTTCCSFLLML